MRKPLSTSPIRAIIPAALPAALPTLVAPIFPLPTAPGPQNSYIFRLRLLHGQEPLHRQVPQPLSTALLYLYLPCSAWDRLMGGYAQGLRLPQNPVSRG